MKVRCIHSNYQDVVPPLDPDRYYSSKQNIVKNKTYTVYGIGVLRDEGKIVYYIIDETGRPRSEISDLFEIVDSQLPIADWHFGLGTEQHVVSLILGYEEFVKDITLGTTLTHNGKTFLIPREV